MTLTLQKEKVKVLYKEPGKKMIQKEIGTNLEDYQHEVHGYIESIPFPGMDDVDIIINEMGKLNGMERNVVIPEYGDVLMGPMVIIGVNEKECIWKSIPDERIGEIENYIEEHQIILTHQNEKGVPEREKEQEMEMEER